MKIIIDQFLIINMLIVGNMVINSTILNLKIHSMNHQKNNFINIKILKPTIGVMVHKLQDSLT